MGSNSSSASYSCPRSEAGRSYPSSATSDCLLVKFNGIVPQVPYIFVVRAKVFGTMTVSLVAASGEIYSLV